MQKVVHFEIPCNEPEKVAAFYSSVFDWQISKWEGVPGFDYWTIVTTGEGEPGINGGLMRKQDPAQPMVNTIQVPSIDEFSQKVEQAGGMIVVPKMPIPGVGYLCYFKDVEGNIFGMMEPAQI